MKQRLVSLILFSLLLTLQYALWFGENNWFELKRTEQELQVQNGINRRLTARNESLAAEVHDLENGGEAAIEIVRRDLGFIRNGEIFYRFVSPENLPTPSPPKDVSPTHSPQP